MYSKSQLCQKIKENKTYLGIELGSTRIKSVLLDDQAKIIANGSYEWKSEFKDGYWTYGESLLKKGLQKSYLSLKKEVKEKYGITLKSFRAIGISAMMHGLLAFDKDMNLLTGFRTWRNTNTEEATSYLTELFKYNIPHRWSIAHLYEAILNDENFVKDVDYLATLSAYIHYLLTGEKVLGIGDASGMFPVDESYTYNKDFVSKFNNIDRVKSLGIEIEKILPKVLLAGDKAGNLTKAGAKLLDPEGDLKEGIALCPPEGDAGTGMIATNAVKENTGNISIGTSIFSMVVLDHPLSDYYKEIDMVTTPDGKPVAMVHCNNGTADFDRWLNIFREFSKDLNVDFKDYGGFYSYIYNKALEAVGEDLSFVVYNYLSGEPINNVLEGIPMVISNKSESLNLSKFILANLYSIMATIRIGQDILTDKENIPIYQMSAHGGIFKTKDIMQAIVASSLKTKINVYESASEGGAWGIACLALYLDKKDNFKNLDEFLEKVPFKESKAISKDPDKEIIGSFDNFLKAYKNYLPLQKFAEENITACK